MVITYQGGNYVKVTAGSLTFLVDPSDERSFRGAKFVVFTEHPAPLLQGKNDAATFFLREPLLIDRPGEYEVEGIRITGYPFSTTEGVAKIAYRIIMENITLAFLGHLTKLPDQKIVGALGGADILFIPGGGAPWLNEPDAAKLVRQLEPGIVVPTLLTKKTCESFVKELGAKITAPAEKLVVKKKDITPKAMTVVCLAA
ncbi:MAG: MBL fold metallo-hydrolase [Candidatus Jorgensenbacteria bacterium]|nr:MBL fold metallo-hydrolase [Candidatus Jorgensenbacteria bacterium]